MTNILKEIIRKSFVYYIKNGVKPTNCLLGKNEMALFKLSVAATVTGCYQYDKHQFMFDGLSIIESDKLNYFEVSS